MRESDFDQFGAMLDAVCSLLSRGTYAPSPANTALWFRALAEHDIEAVRAGFDGHVRDPQRGRFVPTPADIIAQLQGDTERDGRLGAEEAWAIALQARSESATVVWTDEMAQAWFIARPVMDLGDDVGARMAFREVYGRLVADARRQGVPVSWQASLGFDAQGRAAAIAAAVEAGRLPRSELLALPAPYRSDDVGPSLLAQLQAVRDEIRNRPEPTSVDQAERERTRALQAEAARMVAAHEAKGDAACA